MISPLRAARTHRSGLPRGVVLSAMLLCAAMCAVGCGSGFNQSALNVKPNTGSTQVGALKINGVVVVSDPVTRNAEVIAAVANTGADSDQLVSVTADGFPATVHPEAAPVSIAGGSAVSFGQPDRPSLVISSGSLTPGSLTRVEFGFANAGKTEVVAQIMSNTGLYKGYIPNAGTPSPTIPSASPTSSARPSAAANLTASPSAPASYPASIPPENPVSSPAASSGTTLAKASMTLARIPHLHGSREPQR